MFILFLSLNLCNTNTQYLPERQHVLQLCSLTYFIASNLPLNQILIECLFTYQRFTTSSNCMFWGGFETSSNCMFWGVFETSSNFDAVTASKLHLGPFRPFIAVYQKFWSNFIYYKVSLISVSIKAVYLYTLFKFYRKHNPNSTNCMQVLFLSIGLVLYNKQNLFHLNLDLSENKYIKCINQNMNKFNKTRAKS